MIYKTNLYHINYILYCIYTKWEQINSKTKNNSKYIESKS